MGSVASTHSERDHARSTAPGEGSVVTGSSQSEATRSASTASRAAFGPTDGSPLDCTTLRAVSCARSQFTGPVSGAFIICWTWAIAICSCAGSRWTPSADPISCCRRPRSDASSSPEVSRRISSSIGSRSSPSPNGSGGWVI